MIDGGRSAYFAASRTFRDFMIVRPNDAPPAVGVCSTANDADSIGIAYPTGWVPSDDDAGRAAEVTWRLVVHQAELPGRFVLRSGEFMPIEVD